MNERRKKNLKWSTQDKHAPLTSQFNWFVYVGCVIEYIVNASYGAVFFLDGISNQWKRIKIRFRRWDFCELNRIELRTKKNKIPFCNRSKQFSIQMVIQFKGGYGDDFEFGHASLAIVTENCLLSRALFVDNKSLCLSNRRWAHMSDDNRTNGVDIETIH